MNINEIHDEQYFNSQLLDFKISDNITYVGDFGFANSTQLSCIEIGKNVEYLGENCFENCINLKN